MYLEYGRENGSYIESQIYTRRIENKFHLGLQCTVRKIIIVKIPVIEDQLYAVYLHAKYIQISIFFHTLFPGFSISKIFISKSQFIIYYTRDKIAIF